MAFTLFLAQYWWLVLITLILGALFVWIPMRYLDPGKNWHRGFIFGLWAGWLVAIIMLLIKGISFEKATGLGPTVPAMLMWIIGLAILGMFFGWVRSVVALPKQ
ncbi:MAG: hypothetical protein ABIA93_07860 [Candidatus Woesearchaeota archaeon]